MIISLIVREGKVVRRVGLKDRVGAGMVIVFFCFAVAAVVRFLLPWLTG